jgi:hypothetical protein
MHRNKCVPRGWLLGPSRLHQRKHTSISWALVGFFLMLVIQHLKERMPTGVSALIFPRWVGGTLLHAGSHGFVLGRKGVLYINCCIHAPCSSFIHLIPVVDPGRASKFRIAYRGKSPRGQLSSCYSEYVMLACKLVLTWPFNPLVASRSYNSFWYLNPSWLGYPYSFEPLGLHPTAELQAYQESSTPVSKLMCAGSI